MSTVAAFPLFIVRRACRYRSPVISSINTSRWQDHTHVIRTESTVYLVNANTGKTYKGV